MHQYAARRRAPAFAGIAFAAFALAAFDFAALEFAAFDVAAFEFPAFAIGTTCRANERANQSGASPVASSTAAVVLSAWAATCSWLIANTGSG
jgi:hypothetical protein